MAALTRQSELSPTGTNGVTSALDTELRPKAVRNGRSVAELEPVSAPVIEIRDLNVWYGRQQAIFDVKMDILSRSVLISMSPDHTRGRIREMGKGIKAAT